MKIVNMTLKEVFKDNTLKGYKLPAITYEGQSPTNNGSTCYVWNDLKFRGIELKEGPQINEILDRGEVFKPGLYSINNYIDLSDKAYEILGQNVFTLGPNSKTKQQTIRVMPMENKIRVIGEGWGHSMVLFWEGEPEIFLQYLIENQKENKNEV